MYYVIFATDKEGTKEKRLQSRPAHLARLEKLKEEGRLLVAGPNPVYDANNEVVAFLGSTVIAEFASLEDAKEWANSDPYFISGVYQKVEVRPYIVALIK